MKEFLQGEESRGKLIEAMPLSLRRDVARYTAAAAMAVAKDINLQQCNRNSILMCVVDAARFGLQVNTARGHAYLIPFHNRKSGQTICTLQLGYKGIAELARRSGEYATIQTQAVYKGDRFEFEHRSAGTHLIHAPDLDSDRLDEDITHVYAILRFKGSEGYPVVELMSKAQVNKVKNSAKAGNVWQSHWGEMARKTVLKRALKAGPLSEDLAGAMDLDDQQYRPTTVVTPSDQRGSDAIVDRLKGRAALQSQATEEEDDPPFVDEDIEVEIEPEAAPSPEPEPQPPAKPAKGQKAEAKPAPAPSGDPLIDDADDDETWDLNRQ